MFLPGCSFLEKDGTFTNAERRINRVRRVMAPKNGYGDWEITQLLARAMGMAMDYAHPSEIMDEVAATTPSFAGVSFARLDELGSIQWPCNAEAPEGTPVMHVEGFVRGKGRFMVTEYIPTLEKSGPRFPLLLTTGRILSQYNVGAQTRRTENSQWHQEDLLEIHPHDAENRGVRGRVVGAAGQPGGRDVPAGEGDGPGGAGRGLHDVPPPIDAGQRHHDRLFRLGDQLPGIQGDGGADQPVQRAVRLAGQLPAAFRPQPEDRPGGGGGVTSPNPAKQGEKLTAMAEQIATFFATQRGDQAEMVAEHLRRYWTPVMCQALQGHVHAGGDIAPLARAAVQRLDREGVGAERADLRDVGDA